MSNEQNIQTTVAAIKIAHIALFGKEPSASDPASGLSAIKEKREDWKSVLAYAHAISHNDVQDYYVTLPAQLRAVILDWDLTRRLANR